MSTELTSETICKNLEETTALGEQIGKKLTGGEVIELVGDVGSGKTTFVKGLAKGAGSPSDVASPSFTISRIYTTHDFDIYHYDFYRLEDPGVMKADLEDVVGLKHVVIVVEWSKIIADVIPENALVINFEPQQDESRKVRFDLNEAQRYLLA